ncbi:hypothetical protein [Aquitalea aquatilis]|uniref:hypothetical protein n=1 Tax=Aquitalea aquatilis TaxID=1537400 RepID=UPI0010BDCF44|nr:hypothetical protein [Aquitalea aquatilis]
MDLTATSELLTPDITYVCNTFADSMEGRRQAVQAVETDSGPTASEAVKEIFNQVLNHIQKAKKVLEPIVSFIKNRQQAVNLCSRISLSVKRIGTHRAQRSTRRSSTKRAKPSGSSDSDGGPAASDTSDRRIVYRTSLPHYLSFSSNTAVNSSSKSIAHSSNGYLCHAISTLLIWLYYLALIPFQIDISTSSRMGVSHV